MWLKHVKAIVNPPTTGNGNYTTYKNGDDWGMVYDIVLTTYYTYIYISIYIYTSVDWDWHVSLRCNDSEWHWYNWMFYILACSLMYLFNTQRCKCEKPDFKSKIISKCWSFVQFFRVACLKPWDIDLNDGKLTCRPHDRYVVGRPSRNQVL